MKCNGIGSGDDLINIDFTFIYFSSFHIVHAMCNVSASFLFMEIATTLNSL